MVNDPLITQFAQACGANGPLDLRIGLSEDGVLAEGSLHQSFTLIGRDEACDVTLNDPDVHLRHAWFQVVDGRVFAIDLGSRAGLVWPSGVSGPGWLDPGVPVRIGPFRVYLRCPVSSHPAARQFDHTPLQSNPFPDLSRPAVQLDFRNGKRARDRWPVNRTITLVGRAEGCKIHLNAEDIAAYHCGLVHTPGGLWVVDLSGRGVVVSGERMRVAPLPNGAELWVGRFLISCRYPSLSHTPVSNRAASLSSTRLAGSPPPEPTLPEAPSLATTWIAPVLPTVEEDEVPLGNLPSGDPMCGLPSSHIMCDVFRPGAASGSLSAPILVSGTIPGPSAMPSPPTPRPQTEVVNGNSHAVSHLNGLGSRGGVNSNLDQPASELIGTILRQFGELHGQMFDQIQQSLLMMLQLSGGGQDGKASAVQKELAGIKSLNAELGKVQAEIARLAITQALGYRPSATRPASADQIPFPSDLDRTPNTAEAIEDWVQERIGSLQKERQSRWQKLVGLVVAGDEPRG